MPHLVTTPTLLHRVGRSEVDHMVSWLERLAEIDGNPFGARVMQFGRATALLGKGPDGRALGPLFNRVLGFTDADVESIDDLVGLYGAEGLPCRIDVNPHWVGAATMRRLSAAGFVPFRHHDHLYGPSASEPSPDEARSSTVAVRRIDASDRAAWSEVWQNGFVEVMGIEEADGAMVARATADLVHDPRWILFLAECDGRPSAAAALFVQDGVGSLVVAGTHPDFRGRGAQAALLRARMVEAAAQGCDLVVAQAALDASSHRNLERAGLRIAYTRAIWLRPLA